jgi:hypothetical protein
MLTPLVASSVPNATTRSLVDAGSNAFGVAACTVPATARARIYEDNISMVNRAYKLIQQRMPCSVKEIK